MLQFFRSLAKSFIAKILFGVLLLSFGAWGVGDLFRQGQQSTTVVKVGDLSIGPEQARAAVDQDLERLKAQGVTMDRQQAKQFGIIDSAVQGLISRALLDQEAQRLHLAVGDDQVARAISNDPSFHDKDSRFDRARFKSLLAARGMSENEYVSLLRGDIPRETLASIAQDVSAPHTLEKLLFDQRQERRVADFVFLPASSITAVDEPTDAQVKDFYQTHKLQFIAPEYRNFTALLLTAADAAASVTVSDDQLKQAYQSRLGEFGHGELRTVKQMLLPDQATAQKAAEALAHGQDFDAVAKTIAHQGSDTIDLGAVERQNLPVDLAGAVFSTKQGEVSVPAKTTLGWSIVKVTAISPAATKSFNEVKPQLETELRREQSGDALYQLSNKVQDALSAGADLASIAKQFSLKPIVVKQVDANGRGPDGETQTALTDDASAIIKTAFETGNGQTSSLQSANDDKFFVVHTDSITPSVLKPLAQIAAQVKQAWVEDQRLQKAEAKAKALAAEVKPGTTLAAVAAKEGLTVTASEALLRTDTQSALPRELVQKFFGMKVNDVVTAAGKNGLQQGQFIASLKEIRPADAKTDAVTFNTLDKQLSEEIGSELVMELDEVLRQRYPVHVNNAVLDQLF